MTKKNILSLRLQNQQLAKQTIKTPSEMARWFGAIQSQDYGAAKWAIGQRIQKSTDTMIETAFNRGSILRTHALRPTWHFVHPEDILWMVTLNATRVKPIFKYYYRQLNLTDTILHRAQEIFYEALQGGKALMRSELGELLLQKGIPGKGQALGHILGEAEINGLICSGPLNGKKFTYMLLKERVPQAKFRSIEESVNELTKRYFQSHGPATIKDFAWWSGLTMADCLKGVTAQKNLQKYNVDGKQYYAFAFDENLRMTDQAFLLPNFDEYTVAYKERAIFYDPRNTTYLNSNENVAFGNMIIIRGEVVAMWKKTVKPKSIEIQTVPFKAISASEQDKITSAFAHYGAFLKKSIKLL